MCQWLAQSISVFHKAFLSFTIKQDSLMYSQDSLLYGLLNWDEAYLMPTWLMRQQRLAQVKLNQSINQSINQSNKTAAMTRT